MKTIYWLLILGGLFITTTAFQCDEEEVFDVDCPAFDADNLRYFPLSVSDVLTYVDTSGLVFREFLVADRFIFGDTTILSLNPDELCTPIAEFLITEPDDERTVINFFINQIRIPGDGLTLGINFSDFGATGAPYFQQINVEPSVSGGLNTMVTEIDSLTVDGFTYNDVLLAELPTDPDPLNRYFNDVRKLWVAPMGGIIQFEDGGTGLWKLQRP